MGKSKTSKKCFSKSVEQEQEEEIILGPVTEEDLAKFDNVEDYWKEKEKLIEAAKKKKELDTKKAVKEQILKKEEEEKRPEDMSPVERFYWQISQPPTEPLMPSKSYLQHKE